MLELHFSLDHSYRETLHFSMCPEPRLFSICWEVHSFCLNLSAVTPVILQLLLMGVCHYVLLCQR